jgi:hypothetical protein
MVRSTSVMAAALPATFGMAAEADAAPRRPRSSTAARSANERGWAFSAMKGGLRRSGRWTGTFSIRIRVFRGGRFVTNCRLRNLGWRASPV